jgi:catechol 2,3-dioxygenase-like lactoylglutathione lyase family enzyme
MPAALNHTIVWCRDKEVSSRYLTTMLGLSDPVPFGPFRAVGLANNVSMDFHDFYSADEEILSQHYAFIVTEEEFDQIFGRIAASGQDYFADPGLSRVGQINHNDGGRGVYWHDLDGHLLEIITRPCGTG